ncbi:uncharacterized protein Z518_00657 [Rhinocladiella mackenziei CBS 650.93]|uniref:Rhinocladiella mackenziei CBS 650.93 unplaced genomic scaffold supercont1.1, whole genome shotgun sequence n=1 Tax=Rhinocladiella mackenziei CBS 650.93 TaxID=1442369 RepID=A0A0D2G4H0_9EURO|nr:uncharacterized protein Z518_00657 [Rhinocladiella mackenziei CBS 650.93]KIX09577.1 hypothetical protein Z518_00657 [Rhinocladiella mackenziei CBS 650.93]
MVESHDDVVDTLIIGGGPAGLATALYLAQYLNSAIIFDSPQHSKHAIRTHAVPTWDKRTLADLCKAARKEIASHYSTVRFEQRTIHCVNKLTSSYFEARDAEGRRWYGKTVVLAVGVRYLLPDIPGYDTCWLGGSCQCPHWGGRSTLDHLPTAGVLATGENMTAEQAVAEACMIRRLVENVVIYTDGNLELAVAIEASLATANIGKVSTDSRPIERLSKGIKLNCLTVEFGNGPPRHQGFLLHNPKTEIDGPFTRQLGLELTEDGALRTEKYETSIEGVFAVGDCASTSRTILNAMASGMAAATRITAQLQQNR